MTVRDTTYSTVRFGEIPSYDGAFIFESRGRPKLEVGHGPVGGPDWIGEEGHIELLPLQRGEPIDLVITAHSLDGTVYYNADLRVRGRELVASPYTRFATEQDAIDAAIHPAARRLLFVRKLYVVPSYDAIEPASSWSVAVTRALASPTSREWYAAGYSVRTVYDTVN